MSRPSLRHRAEYAGFRLLRGVLRMLPESLALGLGEALGWVAGSVLRIRRATVRENLAPAPPVVALRMLPESLALGLGEALGWVAGSVLRIRRATVRENLARAFPERDDRWRRRVARASYRHLGREGAATFRLGGARTSREWVLEATEVEGMEILDAAVARGTGAIVVTGHLGNWEIGGAAIAARGAPVDAVALVQANRLFDEDLATTRTRLGMEVVARGEASREVLRSLRAGRVPALVADQNARRGGVAVDFFGIPAPTFRGPALFALRTGAPLVVGIALRVSRHPQRYRVVLERVAVDPSGDMEADVARLTRAHTEVLERWIRAAPEQYFWQHKRWKRRNGREPAAPPSV